MTSTSPTKKRILLLSANPRGTGQLRLDEEMREIKEGLRRAREQFVIETAEAVRYRDIRRAILDFEPQIVHFSGHGIGSQGRGLELDNARKLSPFPEDAAEPEGLVFEDETGHAKLIDAEALAGFFKLFADQVECVVLNACYSKVQAQAIAQHINYVIGMSQAIGDRAAIEFAVGFYDGLGAGRSVESAYKLGCNAIRMAGIAEHLTPVLLERSEAIAGKEIRNQKAGGGLQVGGNYVLLSPDTEFNQALWKELEKYKEDLEIIKFIDLSKISMSDRFGRYKENLDDFIRDETAKWLFTIWPEDQRSIWLESDYEQYLEQLKKQEKYIICFESGMTWNKYQKEGSEKSVFIVRTEFSDAVKLLICHAIHYFLKKQKNINIVAILGPRNSPPAQERREIYNQFLEKLYRSRGLYIKDSDYWTGLMKELEHIQNIQTTYLEINNWDKQEAKELVKSIYSSLQGNGIFYQTCFLCGNDQIAIGVNEALREQLKNEYKDERFLYIGFDGISEMEEFMGRGMIGATMKVNFQTMCEKAIEIVKNPRLFMKIPLQPLIPNQISNPDPHE
jgi:hypothetical protein